MNNLNYSILAMAALSLAGCSTGGQRLTRSGFLSDYGQLQKVEKHGNAALWVAAGYEPARYDSVIVEPVQWLAPARDPEVQAKLSQALRGHIISQIAPRYRIVQGKAVGASTLRIRAAITNTRRTRWFVNAPAQLASSLTLGTVNILAPLQGGASVEMQVEDARTGWKLLRMAAYRNGKRWDFKGNYVAYGHAHQAFRQSAELLDGALAGNGAVTVRPGEAAYAMAEAD